MIIPKPVVYWDGFLTDDEDSGKTVLCPVCDDTDQGSNFVHMESVEVDQLGEVTRVTGDGAQTFSRDREYVRGSIVRVVFQCEGGKCNGDPNRFHQHRFALRLLFHKGQTLVSTESLGCVPFDRDDVAAFLRRD